MRPGSQGCWEATVMSKFLKRFFFLSWLGTAQLNVLRGPDNLSDPKVTFG